VRVELNALTSDALVAKVEAGFVASGVPKKAMPDDDVLAEAYRAFHRSHELRERFEDMAKAFDEEAAEVEVPKDLRERALAVLAKHDDLRIQSRFGPSPSASSARTISSSGSFWRAATPTPSNMCRARA
jgi:hypothetical protein